MTRPGLVKTLGIKELFEIKLPEDLFGHENAEIAVKSFVTAEIKPDALTLPVTITKDDHALVIKPFDQVPTGALSFRIRYTFRGGNDIIRETDIGGWVEPVPRADQKYHGKLEHVDKIESEPSGKKLGICESPSPATAGNASIPHLSLSSEDISSVFKLLGCLRTSYTPRAQQLGLFSAIVIMRFWSISNLCFVVFALPPLIHAINFWPFSASPIVITEEVVIIRLQQNDYNTRKARLAAYSFAKSAFRRRLTDKPDVPESIRVEMDRLPPIQAARKVPLIYNRDAYRGQLKFRLKRQLLADTGVKSLTRRWVVWCTRKAVGKDDKHRWYFCADQEGDNLNEQQVQFKSLIMGDYRMIKALTEDPLDAPPDASDDESPPSYYA
ncbi:hypothetical protein F5878DRAFT_702560 [Lentinula raphanica]|uniref:Uncharacterized protein n=1 Tax=Lentinula raphanica TaxID=153919 RepID=A0AA38NYA2_9AGAR|nr:hypothetical protein F5878DRAFT_702560 [Lentinula raphanica]